MHLHSNYSDGQNTLEEVIICAISLGINKICFTDHVWKTSEWVEDYLNEIEYLRIKYQTNIDIIAGVEAKLLNLDGEIDLDDSLYNKKVRVVAAIHRIP
ncbi:MAG TPA: PHP domain-containing protein, partial [Candidatus Pacearchaeota archaeon]|nr:PHP domain-containing protein [Candidatus Pacearchaeota archaeon]